MTDTGNRGTDRMTDTANRGTDRMTDTGTTGREEMPTSVHGDAQTDLSRETARTGAREQGTTGGSMATSAPMSGGPMTAAPPTAAGTAAQADSGQLLGGSGDFAARWQSVQVIFVDEPRRAVEDADRLVREVMDRLTDVFRLQRDDLEKAWHAGGEASTEDLRLALQRYRSFFERLLAA
jgi:hypothetical protein